MVVPLSSWLQALWFLSLLSMSVGGEHGHDLYEKRLAALQQACNQGNVNVLQRYLAIPGFVDQLNDEDCALLMATAIHSTIHGHPRAHQIMDSLASNERFLSLGPLGTTVLEKAMASGNVGMAIHILSHFEVEESSAGQGLVAAAKYHEWKAIEALFQYHDQEHEGEDNVWVVQFEAGALRDFLILTSAQGEIDLFWKAVEVARDTGSLDLEQFLYVIDEGMAASQTFDQLADFVNLLMNDSYEYFAYLGGHRDLAFPFAGQFLHIFGARNIIMEETGVPGDIGNLILDTELNAAMFRILKRPRDEEMTVFYPSSSEVYDADQVNDTIDLADNGDEAGTVDLPPTVMAAPVSGTSALTSDSSSPSSAQATAPFAGDIDLPDASTPTTSTSITRSSGERRYWHNKS